MAIAIETYVAKMPPTHWAPIEAFVRAAVADSMPDTPKYARNCLTAAAQLVDWATRVAGQPLDRNVIFGRQNIGVFIQQACSQTTEATQSTWRSCLNWMSDRLVTGPHRHPKQPPLPKTDAVAPYTPAQVAQLRAWAAGQRSEARRINAHVLLALGLGAGLASYEIGDVRAEHVSVDAEGVLIEVVGKRARTVPVLAAWEATVATMAQAAMRPEQWLFLPTRRVAWHQNTIGVFDGRTNDKPVPVTPKRLRATWLVTHLIACTPHRVLLEAAGITSLEALTRYVRYIPETDPVLARQLLRNPGVTR